MRRATLVIAGTFVGLAGVLRFHTVPAALTFPSVTAGPSGATSSSTPNSSPPTSSAGNGAAAPTTTSSTPAAKKPVTAKVNTSPTTTRPPTPTTKPPTPTTTRAPAPTTTLPPASVRSATGPLVNYYFGELAVAVKLSGSQITSVTIASLNDGGNFRSQSIDSMSIPILEQEGMAAQSARIQGVSGASYTSAGFI